VSGKLRTIVILLVIGLMGTGLGYALARAAEGGGGPSAQNSDVEGSAPGFYDAYYDKGYNRGWREGYDKGYQDGYKNSPSSPDHALTFDEARNGSSRVTVTKAVNIAQNYKPSRLSEADVYDCNDMAEELWNAYKAVAVTSYMVIGNAKMKNESFSQSDHCWVVVFCVNEATGEEITLAIDPQISLVGIIEGSDGAASDTMTPGQESTSSEPPGKASDQYIEGFFYDNPSNVKGDLGPRW
jgi:hypothetical protein